MAAALAIGPAPVFHPLRFRPELLDQLAPVRRAGLLEYMMGMGFYRANRNLKVRSDALVVHTV